MKRLRRNVAPSGIERIAALIEKRFAKNNVWMTLGIGVKRWVLLLLLCSFLGGLGLLGLVWMSSLRDVATVIANGILRLLGAEGAPLLIAGLLLVVALLGAVVAIVQINRTVLRLGGVDHQTLPSRFKAEKELNNGVHLVAVGGGTGLSKLLSGLKGHSKNLTAVVTVSDDGGSSGVLRAGLDMVAPGDLTDCYAALSHKPAMAELLLYRFNRGPLANHTFGNLLLATVSEQHKGLGPALATLHSILDIRGAVYPATTVPATLQAKLSDGRVIRGESRISAELGPARILGVELDPPNLPVVAEVLEKIRNAEMIVLGPGSLFTSILPVLLVPAVQKAVRNSAAPLVYVASMMTEPGETDNMTLADHLEMIEKHLGRSVDWVLQHKGKMSRSTVQYYARHGAEPLRNGDLPASVRVHEADMIDGGSLPMAHHNAYALGRAMVSLHRKILEQQATSQVI